MHWCERFIVFPDGDLQEIDHDLTIEQMVDVNGQPLRLPLGSPRTLAYRVFRISRKESKGEDRVFFHLAQLTVEELMPWVRT